MTWTVRTVRGRYADSVRLMGIARAVRGRRGVTGCEIVMGTPANVAALEGLGAHAEAGPGDVVIAVDADVDEAGAEAVEEAEHLLIPGDGAATGEGAPGAVAAPPRSLATAAAALGGANLALVSVPGEYAALEAHRALTRGLHVLLFSDHVPLEDEIALKERAAARSLLMMGPGCGTAMLGGVGLGFANEVSSEPAGVAACGPVGVVAAAGTGAQEVACLIDAAGGDISHIVGVGGRDVGPEVGGRMMRMGIDLLARDQGTETVLLVAKEPDPGVARALGDGIPDGVRVVAAFVGLESGDLAFETHPTLEAGALAAVGAPPFDLGDLERAVDATRGRAAGGGRLVGLFSGGSLAHEATVVLAPLLGEVAIDEGALAAEAHVVLDLGEERFTQGRPHPMIDVGLRRELLERVAADGRTGAVLLDVVLGYGAHPDPAGELAPAVAAAAESAVVVARVCGTVDDPQDAGRQAQTLSSAGAIVAPSNAAAARLAARAVRGGSA
jgi:FdrA protein